MAKTSFTNYKLQLTIKEREYWQHVANQCSNGSVAAMLHKAVAALSESIDTDSQRLSISLSENAADLHEFLAQQKPTKLALYSSKPGDESNGTARPKAIYYESNLCDDFEDVLKAALELKAFGDLDITILNTNAESF